MKPHAALALAATLGATALAHAAMPPVEGEPVYPKYNVTDLLNEPPATPRTGGADAELATAIADAMSQDDAMKHAKITVQPEKDSVLLTGVALNNAQRQRAAEIAAQHADGRMIVNAIQSEELTIAQTAQAQDEQQPQDQQQPQGQQQPPQQPN